MANTANIKAVITAEDRGSAVLQGFGNKVGALSEDVVNFAKRATFALGAAATAAAGFGIKTAADLETARSAFIGLFGSAEEADKTLKRIKDEAKSTPFEMTGLTEGVKQLASVTKTGDEAIDILLNVGKAVTASGGTQVELDRVVFNLKQIKGLGELSAIDLKELRRAIPIFDKIVEAAGTTVEAIQNAADPAAELFKVFETGGKKISAVDQAFTLQGGNFNQVLSNMKDSLAIFTSDLVKEIGLFDLAKKGISAFTNALTNNKDKIVLFAKQTIDAFKLLRSGDFVKGMNFGEDSPISVALLTLRARFFDVKDAIVNLYQTIQNYLQPKIVALWNTLTRDLMPALITLWKNILWPVIEAFSPAVGIGLVWAIGLTIDVINILVGVVSGLTKFLAEHQAVVASLAVAFGVLAGAMAIGAAIDAIKVGFATLQLVTIPGLQASFVALGATMAAALPVIAVATAAAAIVASIMTIKDAWNAVNAAERAANNLGNDEQVRQLQKQATAARAIGDTKKVDQIANAIAALSGGRASGGEVYPGSAYMVGESGPEMFVPQGRGKIVPNNQISNSSNINVTFNGVFTGNQQEFRKLAIDVFKAYDDAKGMGTV